MRLRIEPVVLDHAPGGVAWKRARIASFSGRAGRVGHGATAGQLADEIVDRGCDGF